MRSRSCGVLLHISSLPSAFGIGDLGPAAHNFARLLAESGLTHWQFLPLTPTSTFIGNSPYSSPSAFAGNPLFISPELLAEDGFISFSDLDSLDVRPAPHTGHNPAGVDFEAVSMQREGLLNLAFARNQPQLRHSEGYKMFCSNHARWLDDYALFMSIKEQFGGKLWTDWPEDLKNRHEASLAAWQEEHFAKVERHKFIQYLFFRQWDKLHRLCRLLGLRLVGDLPIYVTHDSVDVWANPALFDLNGKGLPNNVAGVPPDYFSATGQRWGNPVYRWEAMQADSFAWWRKRLEHNLILADMIRLDHFRGFAGYWEIPATEETAVHGRWKDAPGQALFRSATRHLGQLQAIAEDLGVITSDVRELMFQFQLPGMRVLQFAFGHDMSESVHIPFNYSQNTVVYTGTHDNQTSRQWFAETSEFERNNLRRYAGCDVHNDNAHIMLARLALSSPADLAVLPMQDILGLGAEGRMNTPSTSKNNWGWRMKPEEAVGESFAWLRELCRIYGRA